MATFRESINNLIRGDMPESPTEVVFLTGSLAIIGLMIYATQTGKTIPGFEAYLLALGGYKGVKVWKGKGAASAEASTSP